jgi:hypothetical protein
LTHGFFTTLTFGINSSAALTHFGLMKIAESHPEVASIIKLCTYVNDICVSMGNEEELKRATSIIQEALEKYGLFIKGSQFAISNQKPPPELADEDNKITVAGCNWSPHSDTWQLRIPKLYLGRKLKGNTEGLMTWEQGGTVQSLYEFFPKTFNLRNLLSRASSYFDTTGLLTILIAPIKLYTVWIAQ